jgi:FAD/FMN-containing dehydrogenase
MYSATSQGVRFIRNLRAMQGQNYKRLAKIKKRYDPGNLFGVNQNIRPR